MTDAITGLANTAAGTQSAAQSSAATLAEDFSTFLTLLTTQLQNQDPMDPLDSNEFTNQLVAFTGVEQQIQTNQNLEDLLASTKDNNLAGVAGFLGQEALINGNTGTHEGNGIRFEVDLAQAPDKLAFEILNDVGDVVHRGSGSLFAGRQEYMWDGTNELGQQAPDGDYSLRVGALVGGDPIASTIFVQDEITSVDTSADEILLSVGPQAVRQDEILRLVGIRQHNGQSLLGGS